MNCHRHDPIRQADEARRSVEENRARFHSILESLEHIPVQGYDAQRRVIYWNHASTVVYGYERQEALGRHLEDLIIPDGMRDEVISLVDACLAGGPEIPAGELVLRDKNGDPVHVYSSHVMHETMAGDLEMFCIDVDLREQKELEAQYRQAQKMEAVGRLAGGIAHDFNNLLQVIAGYTALALEDEHDPELVRDALEHIQRSSHRATELVGQLLAFSRQRDLDSRPLDFDDVVSGVMPFIARLIGDDIVVEQRLHGDLPPVLGDRGKLEQIIMNLCVNARDAMPAGGRIEIATAPGADGVVLTVSDDGLGMEEHVQEKIFEPFFTTKGAAAGTGLGLAMVHGLVQQHGGEIRCDTALGRGTTFTIQLPVADG